MMPTKKRYGVLLIFTMLHFPSTLQDVRILKDNPEECFTFKELDDDTRLFENPNPVPTSKADDLSLEKGWYRIMGKTANSLTQGFPKALTGSVSSAPNFCGTVYPGTLMGSHPTVEEGMVEMTVCFRSKYCFYKELKECTCKSKKTIYVRNCLNHFIYWLSPTGRQQRYCTGRTDLKGPTIIDNRNEAVECNEYAYFEDDTRMWNRIGEVKSDQEEGWYRFSKPSGKELSSRCSVTNEHISRMAQPCGAAFRGHMVDRHPSIKDGRVTRRICFSYTQACDCEFYASIDVRNCGNYFVYRVKPPPLQNARYCGTLPGFLSAKTDAGKPAPENKVNRDICKMYDVRHDPDRLWSYTSPTVKKCDAHFYGRFRFGSKYTPWSIKEGCNKTDMAVVTHRCGAQYQGFMEGRHPEVSEKYVERIICFQEASAPCECSFNAIIGVQNCSGFYVYDLRGVPKCHSRFCMVANKTTKITVDPGRPPMYAIPIPGHAPVVAQKSQNNKEGENLMITTTVLSIVLLIVLIILIVIIIILLACIRPLYNKHNEEQKRKSYMSNNNVQLTSVDKRNSKMATQTGSNGNIPRDYNVEGYKHLPSEPPDDSEDFPSYGNLPPRPSRAPPIDQPEIFSPDLPPMPSDDDKYKISPTSDKSFPDLPEEVKNSDDSGYDVYMEKENIRKAGSDQTFDSAV